MKNNHDLQESFNNLKINLDSLSFLDCCKSVKRSSRDISNLNYRNFPLFLHFQFSVYSNSETPLNQSFSEELFFICEVNMVQISKII